MTDQTPSAGATPVAAGATPAQSKPAQPAVATPDASTEPATGYPDGMGDAGKRALDTMKAAKKAAEDRAATAERERDELRASTQSEAEKAITAARKEGATEASTKYHAAIRRSEVRAALTAAGVDAGVLDLATRADEFGALKVNDQGDVEGLTGAVEAFKKAMPNLFRPPTRPTGFDGGPRGGAATGFDMNSVIRKAVRGR